MNRTDKILAALIVILGMAGLIVFVFQRPPAFIHLSNCLLRSSNCSTRKDYNDELTTPEALEIIPGTPFTAYLGKTYGIQGTKDEFMLTGFLYTGPECPAGAIYGRNSSDNCIAGEQHVYYKIVVAGINGGQGKTYEESATHSDSSSMNRETSYLGAFLTNNNTDYKNFALMTIETESSLRAH